MKKLLLMVLFSIPAFANANTKLPFSFITECKKVFNVGEVKRADNRYSWKEDDCQFLPQGQCLGSISVHSICGGAEDGVTVMNPKQAQDMPNGGVLFYTTYNREPCDWGTGKSAHIAVVYQCFTPTTK
ncbi:hypothetical protein [Aeromonas dhakensis]|uniref:hypothetical protein n=1 Tax=Aeromonas dhakensis TaxID=196024 RepID=UPI001F61D5B3|nr:hypothetical protein [Aeromonas dhakensis]UNU87431.1 hypothetical protein GB930_04115 [Aeromonas dhakensis]HDX8376912.1 hypothetical protein [Aeromonas dhakensis]